MLRNSFARALTRLAERIGTYSFIEERDAYFERRLQKSISGDLQSKRDAFFKERSNKEALAQAPEHWRSWFFMRQGFRVSVAKRSSDSHSMGGPPRHKNAICPLCRNPFLLIWDIDCRDPLFDNERELLLDSFERIPLYYCAHCGESAYQLEADGSIRIHRVTNVDESPFEDFPNQLEQKSIELSPIPRDIENLIRLADDVGFDWLDAMETGRLSDFMGQDIFCLSRLEMSQFGGSPRLIQGHSEDNNCVHRKCPTHKYGHYMMGGTKRHFWMKELAVVDMDIDLGMDLNYSQIAFHICWKCNTVYGEYRCS